MKIIFLVINFLILRGYTKEIVEWVVKINGGPKVAERVAENLGYDFGGLVKGFKDTYIFFHIHTEDLYEKRGSATRINNLKFDPRVSWAEMQQSIFREKRGFINLDLEQYLNKKRNNILFEDPRTTNNLFNDELWSQEWYLQDTRTRKDLPRLDLNVLPVYKLGITGKNVRVTILDDGIEYTHDDLRKNYEPEISYDCNENDYDPLPRYDAKNRNSHGTRCAGEVAMSANNTKCGVGVAFDAKIGGIKLLDGNINDRIEGTALGYAHDLVDIYSASWGPNDDGKTVDGPGTLAKEALERGISEGRNGLGCIYVWASGNGGSKGDNCNCDGYLTSRYTISIGSASQRGEFPWYGEECASTLAVTYSSGAYQDQMIATTDLQNACTIKHTGTSASAPLAAGIIALVLQANPQLTWRDVQHLIVFTSEYLPLSNNKGWIKNAAGLWYNTRFGFGLMNAHILVTTAFNWTTVPEAHTCTILANKSDISIEAKNPVQITFYANDCQENVKENMYLEHVELKTTIDYTIRGHIEVFITSPSGSKTQLLQRRRLDKSKDGFQNWTFMSVMTWGETSTGKWLLEIVDKVGNPEKDIGKIKDTSLVLHGTLKKPKHMENGPRVYNENYNRLNEQTDYEDSYENIYSDYNYVYYL